MCSCNRRRDGPKAKEEDNNTETHCPGVDDDTENAWKMKRSPDKLISLARIICYVCHLSDSTGASAPEEKAFSDNVRSVETAYAQGDDIVERGGRADVDQPDETGDQGYYHDCKERDRGLRLHLRAISQDV